MRRLMTIALTALVAFAVSPAFGAGTQEEGSPAEDTVELVVASWHADFAEPFDEIFESFRKDHPNVSISYEFRDMPQYYNYINTAIQAGSAPDIFSSNGNKVTAYVEWARQGVVVPLDDKIDVSEYPAILVDVTKVDGNIYMSPGSSYGSQLLYYNKTIFDRYGLEEPETFDELLENCQVLLENGVTPIALGGMSLWEQWMFPNSMVTSLATDWVEEWVEHEARLDDPRFKDAYGELFTFRDKGYFGQEYKSQDGSGAILSFTQGDAGMIVEGVWNSIALRANQTWDVRATLIPNEDGIKTMVASPTTSTGFSLYSGTQHEELSLELIRHFMKDESEQTLIELGKFVPAFDWQESPNPHFNQVVEARDRVADQLYNYFAPIAKDGYNVTASLQEYSQQVLYGQISLEEMIQRLESQLDYSKANLD